MINKKILVNCVKELYNMGFTSPVSGNHSIRIQDKWMWITPSSIPRYTLKEKDLVKVHLESSKTGSSGSKPSIEWRMHVSIYDKLSQSQKT